MSESFALVVGDGYKHFANGEAGVLTISELRAKAGGTEAARLIVGQGLSGPDRDYLARCGGALYLDELASTEVTHKRARENVLITAPVALGEGRYQYLLAVNDSHDRLADHVTGKHINGMLLVEAARQACIATIESEHPRDEGMRWGLSWNNLDVQFVSYTFPGPVSISVSIETDRSKKEQLVVNQTMNFVQAGKSVCTIKFRVTLVDGERLERLESRSARSTTGAIRQQAESFCEAEQIQLA
jgi:hypothetical protein